MCRFPRRLYNRPIHSAIIFRIAERRSLLKGGFSRFPVGLGPEAAKQGRDGEGLATMKKLKVKAAQIKRVKRGKYGR